MLRVEKAFTKLGTRSYATLAKALYRQTKLMAGPSELPWAGLLPSLLTLTRVVVPAARLRTKTWRLLVYATNWLLALKTASLPPSVLVIPGPSRRVLLPCRSRRK